MATVVRSAYGSGRAGTCSAWPPGRGGRRSGRGLRRRPPARPARPRGGPLSNGGSARCVTSSPGPPAARPVSVGRRTSSSGASCRQRSASTVARTTGRWSACLSGRAGGLLGASRMAAAGWPAGSVLPSSGVSCVRPTAPAGAARASQPGQSDPRRRLVIGGQRSAQADQGRRPPAPVCAIARSAAPSRRQARRPLRRMAAAGRGGRHSQREVTATRPWRFHLGRPVSGALDRGGALAVPHLGLPAGPLPPQHGSPPAKGAEPAALAGSASDCWPLSPS